MDISEQYIKMCEGAEEIQRKSTLYPGDTWFHSTWGEGILQYYWPCLNCDNDMEKLFHFDGYGLKRLEECGFMIWLPRQNQLQEMVATYHKEKDGQWFCWICTHVKFDQWLEVFHEYDANREMELAHKGEKHSMASMEQLWIQYVMKEKYGKTWDGTQWVKEK